MNGKTENLKAQIDKLFKSDNQKSIKTRYRYRDAAYRFCSFLGENTNLKKIKNIKSRHIYEYVKFLQLEQYSPAYIYVELSGIRFFHNLSGSKEVLPSNDRLNLEHRIHTGVSRAWSDNEVKAAIQLAEAMNRYDVSMAIKACNAFGLRLEEAVTLTTKQIKEAICSKELNITNTKGNHPRVLNVVNLVQVECLHYLMMHKANENRIFIKKYMPTHKVKKSIQDWIRNHRNEFQDKNRISSKLASRIVRLNNKMKIKSLSAPKSNLTMHGNRHAFAQRNFKARIQNNDSTITAKKDTSELLGHHRMCVTNIYLTK